MKRVIQLMQVGDKEYPAYWCPVCDWPHWLDNRWKWNGDFDRPTFGPSSPGARSSYLSFHTNEKGERQTRCHVHVTDGNIKILDDTPGPLSGKTVPLLPWDLGTWGS